MAADEVFRYLGLSEGHLNRVQSAWDQPTDWDDLTIYGLYCVEAAVMAAAEHVGLAITRSHRAKMELAERLSTDHGLPEIADLMPVLNTARKAAAYGDTIAPELDPEDVAVRIEEYVDAVRSFVQGDD